MRKRINARACIMFCLPPLSTAMSTAEGRTCEATEPAADGACAGAAVVCTTGMAAYHNNRDN